MTTALACRAPQSSRGGNQDSRGAELTCIPHPLPPPDSVLPPLLGGRGWKRESFLGKGRNWTLWLVVVQRIARHAAQHRARRLLRPHKCEAGLSLKNLKPFQEEDKP